MMQKEYEKALAYFERAITLDGNNFQFVICKGQALFHLGMSILNTAVPSLSVNS
jgi:tetratricopeptide (TPR) repeat protein